MVSESEDNQKAWGLIFICWLVSVISTGGSLFFSEVMGFLPCILCWYQRILMYPLVIIFLVGLFPLDKNVFKYTIPFVISGWLIALYHNLLHTGIIPESASPCSQGVPCTAVWIEWLGFITIPILSFTAFTGIGILLLIYKRRYLD